jgi:two-component system CheB/CheR fusion protein
MEAGHQKEQVTVEQALRDHVARLRSVVETAADGIITINERGLIETVNPAAARMFGYNPAELIGRNVSMLMPKPFSVEHDRYLENYLRTGRAKIIGIGRDLTALRKDGSAFPMRLAVSEMTLSGRRAFTGIVSDLSERRRLERQVLESAASEQRRIGQDLHDGLCQQLAALGMSLELLKRKSANGAADPAQFEKLQQLLSNSIGQLRQVAHGLQPVQFRVGGLPAALRDLANSTSERFHINCRARCSNGADVDDQTAADHLYRIAQEATGNAIKHGRAKRVRISLVAMGESLQGVGGLSLAVLDDGIGIPDTLPTITGMGLRIMKYRADAIGADFRLRRRRAGRGTSVCCMLPPKTAK